MPIINTVYPQTGSNTGDATATAAQILSPYTAYVASGKVTGSIQSQGAQTITPGVSDQTIPPGKYLSGAQTILGDSNLIAGNIKQGVSIFGVTGTVVEKSPRDYSYQSSSSTYILSLTIATYDLGTPNILCVNATSTVGRGSGTVSGLYSTISRSATQGTAYIAYGAGNVLQTTSQVSNTVNRNFLTLGDDPGSVNIYLPTGYTFNGTYNIFVSFFV